MAAMGKPEQMEVLSQDAITGEGSSCSAAEIKPDSHCGEIVGLQVQPPEDILHRIHALMPMRDAAQAACVSHAFLRSWRCYPNLIISVDSLCINEYGSRYDELTMDFITRVEHIMQNHSGMGVKEFRLQSYPCSTIDPSYLDHWIQVAMTPGIKEFELSLFEIGDIKYSFPCSLLSSERGSSIQSLMLSGCSIHSTAQVGCMSSLTNLVLYSVAISGKQLLHFLSNSCALEKISLSNCNTIICLKIPCQLQKLNILSVLDCQMLEMIDSNAPNLSTFSCTGRQIHISLGHAFQVKEIRFSCYYSSNALSYAITKLPFIAPNLQTLFLLTSDETINTPMTLGKFLQLKYLEITLCATNFSPDYDFSSLLSFLDASPTLETLIIRIWLPTIRHDSILEDPDGDSSQLQCLSECYHDNLKNVMITGFCSAKSMVKLTIHIVQKARSLDCLTLDTTGGHDKRFANIDRCWPLNEAALVEAGKARVAIERYIEERVPPSVNLKIIEPCSKCTYR
ncbi:putative F-box/FBD/LRR-repeat protein At4g00315 [Miscanthus floridulus]|uniref:putative F-box/FBD/LRR-repeat protein At4g00315 n=1 Tax=Miscanthus floridulus TaxID=154761 RepID=UPI00345B2D4B